MSLPVSFIKQNNVEYEIVDKVARNNLEHKKVAMIGDSFCTGGYGDYANGVASAVQQHLGLSDDDFVLKAKNGVGFVNTVDGENYQTFVDDLVANYPNAGFTDIIVQTAGNDASASVSDINIAKQYIVNTIRTQYPNAKIWWVLTCGTYSITSRRNIHNKVAYVLLYPSVAKEARFIDASAPLYLTKYHTDSVHPTERGCTLIGMIIANNVMGNDDGLYEIADNQNGATIHTASGITWSASIRWKLENKQLTFKIGASNITGTFNFNYGGQIFVDLGTFDNFIIPFGDGVPAGSNTDSVLMIPVDYTAWTDNNTYGTGTGQFIITNINDVPHIYFAGIRNPTLSATHIYLQGVTISVPCNY